MELPLHNLGAYSLDILGILVAAGVSLRVWPLPDPRVRYGYWRLLLVAALVVPLVVHRTALALPSPSANQSTISQSMIASAAIDAFAVTPTSSAAVRQPRTTPPARPPVQSGRWPTSLSWASLLVVVLVGGLCLRIGWLALGFVRLRRLRVESTPVTLAPPLAQLCLAIAPHATVCEHDTMPQPVTFGFRRPIILLPRSLQTLPMEQQCAILCHELLHVGRADWLSVLAEEAVRTVFWFHPVVRWVLGQLHVTREQIVDARAIAITGARRSYLDALLAVTDETPLVPVSGFGRRHHLALRVRAILDTATLSRRQLVMRTTALVAAISVAGWITLVMWPLYAAAPVLASRTLWFTNYRRFIPSDSLQLVRDAHEAASSTPVTGDVAPPIGNNLDPARDVPPVAQVAAPSATEAARQRFTRAAEKYRDIGSYEGTATASRSYPPDLEVRSTVRISYASERFVPPDLDVPSIPGGVGYCCSQWYDANGQRTSSPSPSARMAWAAPGSGGELRLDQLTRRLVAVSSLGTETLTIADTPKVCDVLDSTYGPTRAYPNGHTVRYWIDQTSDTIWRLRFDQKEHLVEGDAVTWTLTFDTWTENQPPPLQTLGMASRGGNPRPDLVGKAAPEISGRLGTMPFALSNLHGKVVVVAFWVTACGRECAAEMGMLERVQTLVSNQDVQIISVTEDAADDVAAWITWWRRSLPVAIADPGTTRSYEVHGMPDIVVIDRNGTIVEEWAGLAGEKRLTAAIHTALAK